MRKMRPFLDLAKKSYDRGSLVKVWGERGGRNKDSISRMAQNPLGVSREGEMGGRLDAGKRADKEEAYWG